MLTESCGAIFSKRAANRRASPDGPEKKHHLAKVLEVALESVLVHARCQASHENFLGALWVDIVQGPPGWLFFLGYSLLRLDLAPEV